MVSGKISANQSPMNGTISNKLERIAVGNATGSPVDAITAAFKRMMYGKELTDVEQEALGGLAALCGVKKYPIRIKCALLPWTTLQEGVDTHRGNS